MKLPLSLVLGLSLVACGEKDTGEEETETETEDYSAYCNEDPDANLIADDADCDGTVTADDCDDADENSTIIADDGDCDGTLTADDCDDADADSLTTAEDGDCDGTVTAEDCDDADENSTIIAEDGDCDGTVTAEDCDDADENSTIIAEDGDCDGVLSADDCNDADENSTTVATDADCDTFLTADDCDDNNPNAYPGTGANEENQDAGLCYTDADGDGYGDSDTLAGSYMATCYILEMTDTFGDGWNGNEIEIQENGFSVGFFSNDDSYDEDEPKFETHCIDSGTTTVDFVFHDGNFNSEVDFALYYDDGQGGVLIAEGEGSGSFTFTFDGVDYTDGDSFFTDEAPFATQVSVEAYGTDCDDSDGAVNPSVDGDTDGFNVCDDCDDTNADINPAAEDEWYDGIDSDCDGWSDYDMDMDGYDAIEYAGSCSDAALMNQWDCEDAGTCSDATYTDQEDCEDNAGTWTSAGNTWTTTGDDCDDDDDEVHPLANEADPTACYEDGDGDGWGDTNVDTEDGLTAGTDCDDWDDTIYPGAAYNELDVDGDGVTDCTQDADGDGWGSDDPADDDALAGTDCDDETADMAPGDDTDGDGVDSCNDCDDDDATLQGGIGYWDDDGDGYGDMDDEGMLICDFTVDDDTDGNPDYSATNDDCDDEDADINPGTDGDSDGAHACADCDDEDGSVVGLEAYADNDGDGFGSGSLMWVCALDEDGDGEDDYSVDGGDCYDSGGWWATSSPFIYPGAAYNEPDIDGDGNPDCTEDLDGDGWGDSNTYYGDFDGTDCDDDDADLNNDDLDTDGFATCEDANGLVDCDDDDVTTYPGAGFNEAGFDPADYTTYECLTDGDGDGYAYYEILACYTFDLEDSLGDGWNGNEIEVFADGVSYGAAYVAPDSADGGLTDIVDICVPDGSAVEFVFNDGSWTDEISGEIFGADGTSLGTLQEGSSMDLEFAGAEYDDGEVIFSETAAAQTQVGGTDADDTDASVQ